MTRRPLCEFLVASCVPEGGACRYRLYEDGELEHTDTVSMPSPMFLQATDVLWAVLRAPFSGSVESGFAAYDLKTGKALTDIVSTKGTVACHIAVEGNDVYCANYVSGSVFKSPNKLDVHCGHGVNAARQESPHVHSVLLSPDKKYLLSCDLGLDTVFVYDRDLNEISRAKVPNGNGARHAVFSKDGSYVYCMNEMSATVSVFAYDKGHLTYLREVDIKPEGYIREGKGSAIKLSRDGKRLYVTERGSETIALLAVNGEELTPVSFTDSHGAEPRDFSLIADERWAICTNQFGNNFSLYKVEDDGRLTFVRCVPLPAPLCVIEL